MKKNTLHTHHFTFRSNES